MSDLLIKGFVGKNGCSFKFNNKWKTAIDVYMHGEKRWTVQTCCFEDIEQHALEKHSLSKNVGVEGEIWEVEVNYGGSAGVRTHYAHYHWSDAWEAFGFGIIGQGFQETLPVDDLRIIAAKKVLDEPGS